MPMLPSPLAASLYVAIKMAGYAAFASGLNRVWGTRVSAPQFAAGKTLLGFLSGAAYLWVYGFWISSRLDTSTWSELGLWVGAAWPRLVVWLLALKLFYRQQKLPSLGVAALAGVAWSYALDAMMWGLYRVLPGMVWGFC